jgi:TRAP-type uncharacterized transport system fused permease subunit
MRTGWQAMRLAAVAYFIPFMFMYSPALLLIGGWQEVMLAAVTAIIGVIALAAGIEGYLLREASWYERVGFMAAGMAMITHSLISDIAGLGVLALLFANQLFARTVHARAIR